MTSEEYMALYEKLIAGTITQEEEKRLLGYKDRFKWHEISAHEMEDEDRIKDRVYDKIVSITSGKPAKVIRLRMLWLAAAVALLAITAGIVFFRPGNIPSQKNNGIAIVNHQEIKPGSNRAVLTLANGSVIQLSKANNGVLSSSGKISISKLSNGQLVYKHTNEADIAAIPTNNILTIPRGGQYQITLTDGTRVWLNAQSTLTYPTSFSGAERIVELKGEAYFEVAKNPQMPFKVKANGVEVAVLGTHFNVNAYGLSTVKTTLLEGSVRLSNGNSNALLKPGQQGITSGSAADISVREVKVNEIIAWKNGFFIFHDDQIGDIMEQVSRWYDVDVEYQGNVTNKTFGGIYSKSKDISELLKGLELTGLIHFRVEGRRVIVMQ